MIAATGHSHELDSADAIAEALGQCAEALGGKQPGGGLLFVGIDHDFQVILDAIEARYPGVQLIGCTTHGELSTDGFAEDSVSLMLFHSDNVAFGAGVGENVRADPEGAARLAVGQARDGLTLPIRLGITLPEGLGLDMKLVTDSLHDALGSEATLCGGMAGDQVQFKQTYQFCNGRVYSDAVPVLVLAGPITLSFGVASGWVPMGEPHQLTRTEGQTIYEVDGEPVKDVWQRYFGGFDIRGSRNQFAVYPEAAEKGELREFYLCAPSHFQEDGGLATLNPIIPGAMIRFSDATRDQVLEGTTTSVNAAAESFDGTPDAALVFSCAGRHALLGTRIAQEIELLQNRLGSSTPVAGFYTYGEICPLPGSPMPYTHGTTFVTVLLREES